MEKNKKQKTLQQCPSYSATSLQNSIISQHCGTRSIWQLIKTILKANYSTVTKQEITMSKHKDVSMQNALQVSLTDDCCLLVILVSLISSTSSKKGRGYFRTFAFEKIFKYSIFSKITKVATWINCMLLFYPNLLSTQNNLYVSS